MRIRAAFVSAGMMAMITAGAGGCTHAGGSLPVDQPKVLAFQAPDIDEITGIDSSEEDASESEKPAAAPTPDKPADKPAANQAQKPHH